MKLLYLVLSVLAIALIKPTKSNAEIIDTKINSAGVRVEIAVDENDTVRVWDYGLSARNRATSAADLGARILRSGNLEVQGVLPKGKVAVLARRVKLTEDLTIHAIVAWG